jgi:hypothetical protein
MTCAAGPPPTDDVLLREGMARLLDRSAFDVVSHPEPLTGSC